MFLFFFFFLKKKKKKCYILFYHSLRDLLLLLLLCHWSLLFSLLYSRPSGGVPRTQGWTSSLFKISYCQELAFKPEDVYSKNISNPHPQRLVLSLVVTNPRSFNCTFYRLLRGCSSVGRASAGSISGAAREFSPRVNFQCRLSCGVRTPPCAVTCIYILFAL